MMSPASVAPFTSPLGTECFCISVITSHHSERQKFTIDLPPLSTPAGQFGRDGNPARAVVCFEDGSRLWKM